MRRSKWRIGTRLLIAQALVLLATVVTAWVIAAIVGPPLFHEHMLRADHPPDPSELDHVEAAFRMASAIALGIAVSAAAVIALAATWYLARRFQRPLAELTAAAERVSEGRFDTRMSATGAGPELDAVGAAFNTMAAQLEHTEDTRRRLLSDVAHELRTPLATLTAYVEGLDDGVTVWNPASHAVLRDQVARLSRLANDIAAVSRAEEGRLELELAPVAVVDLVGAAVEAQRDGYVAQDISLNVEAGAGATVAVDRTRMLQVLDNLLDNAKRHTRPSGHVTISWHVVHGEVAISIADDGEGIPSAQLPHVFERFYRGDTARVHDRQGSGIGLTISRAIVQAHRGHITAESDGPGSGTRFMVSLPRAGA